MKLAVMWSETVGLRRRPVWEIGLDLSLVHCGLGLADLVLCCETRCSYTRRHNDLEGLSNFANTVYSFFLRYLEHHYCDQRWRSLT